MLKLKELSFSGIGRFVEKQTISLDSYGNLIQVDGQNLNTGGSSGAGKSTIFNALDFLFGLNSVPNSVLQSRLTDENIEVEAIFDYNCQKLTVSRGKKLKIDIDGDITTGSSKISEEKLDQILEIPRHLFRQILHKKQGEKGFFLNLTPKETNDFLTDALNLGHFNKYIDNLENKRLDLSKIVTSLTNDKQSGESALAVSKNSLEALGTPPTRSVDQATIIKLKENADAARAIFNETAKKLDLEDRELERERPVVEVKSYHSPDKKGLELGLEKVHKDLAELNIKEREFLASKYSEQAGLQASINEAKRKVDQGAAAQTEAIKLGLELKKIKQSICPTCEQGWENEKIKIREIEILSFIEQLKSRMGDGVAASQKLTQLEEDLKNSKSSMDTASFKEAALHLEKFSKQYAKELSVIAQHERDFIKSQNDDNMVKLVDFKAKQDLLRKNATQVVMDKRNQADLTQKLLDIAVAKFKSYEEENLRYTRTLQKFTDTKTNLQQNLQVIQESLDKTKKDLEYVEELRRAVKSYLSRSFDEALEVIGENATNLVRSIPNMANSTTQLFGTKETKEGKVKEEVTAQIHLDGEENIDIRSLSGGERASIDLAIDLSVIELIENRTNKGINIFILDEPFTGLDSANVEMVLDMLKSSSINKKLVIVDHNPIVKEQISDRITVVRKGLISHIE